MHSKLLFLNFIYNISATSHLALDGFNTLHSFLPLGFASCELLFVSGVWLFGILYHVPKPVSEVFNGFCWNHSFCTKCFNLWIILSFSTWTVNHWKCTFHPKGAKLCLNWFWEYSPVSFFGIWEKVYIIGSVHL